MLRVKGWRFKFLTVVFLILLLFGGSCLKPPALPKWDINLRIPVYQRTVRLGEILSNNEKFKIQPDSSLVVNLVHQWGPVTVDGAVSLVTIEKREKIALEDLVFSRVGQGKDGVSCSEFFGPIPDTGLQLRVERFSSISERRCVIENIEFVDLHEAVVVTKVENRTPLFFDAVTIRLLGNTVNLGSLGPDEVQEKKIRVGGMTLVNPIDLEIEVCSPGSGADTVRILPQDSVLVNIELDSLRIGGGRLKIHDCKLEKKVKLEIAAQNPLRIDSVILEQGRCVFTVGNRLPVSINVVYDFPKIGVRSSQTIQAGEGMSVDFNLTDVVIDNLRKSSGVLELISRVNFDSQGEFVDVTKDCELDIGYVISDAMPKVLVGMFRQPVYIFSRIETIPELIPFGVRGARFASGELVLEGENYVGFPMDIFVSLRAIKNQGVVASVEDVIAVSQRQGNLPVSFDWRVPVTSLLNTGPDFIICEYNVRMRGYGRYETGQSVCAGAILNVPLRLALVPDTIALPEREVELSDEEIQSVRNHLVTGGASIGLKSALPFEVNGKLVLHNRASIVPDILVDSVIIPFAIPAGIVNNQGRCVAERDTLVSVSLDSVEVSLFKSSSLSAGLILELPATETIVVYTGDQIKLDAAIELKVRIDYDSR